MPSTNRPSYGRSIRWIAEHDSPGDEDGADELSGYISVQLVADQFGRDAKGVAIDVIRTRNGRGRYAASR